MTTACMNVEVDYDDFMRAHERAIQDGYDVGSVDVMAEVDLSEALEHATIEDLQDALRREQCPGYSREQIEAIRDCFSALAAGDCCTARALLTRIFDHQAQINAAEAGMGDWQRIPA